MCILWISWIRLETTASPGPELVVSKDHLRADTAMRIQDQGFRIRKAGLVNPIPPNISSIVPKMCVSRMNPCECHPRTEYLLNSPKDVCIQDYPVVKGEGS